ncbi:MAG: MmcQ/YjbR family DNA-binding protein [Acidimicrobiales bacterium]
MTNSPLDQIQRRCAGQHGATQDNTFGPQTDVYRVGEKIFAMVNDDDGFVTLKADPEDVLALQQQYDFVRPGYYMNKRHWVTVDMQPDLPVDEVRELVDDSYLLVFESLTKAVRNRLAGETAGAPER